MVLQDSNMNELDLGFDFQGNNGENSQKWLSFWRKISSGWSM